MVWEQIDVNRPHLVYIILGGFTSLFMLCSSIIKEKFYIGEATVATICGIIFGPHAAGLIVPGHWGNTDQITLEFSRIVLVVQCFAVGVELPKAYMEKHWRSVVFLLVPVMTFGWLVTSLFIWATMHDVLNWLDSLCIAACVTATDPVLASSVVGKGKFAKRVPKHLRDLLSAESGCNDGMAFPFIYLSLYLIRYRPDANAVAFNWIVVTILYQCVFGAIYGVIVGYAARRAIRYAHEHELIDRESFLVFYFVLALFCAGSGSILGIDDLLVGFACGVGFSNDGWFLEKTEEAHVSNVIDLLINLAFFVYFGTIIPWQTYNSAIIGTSPWRLVVIALLVLFLRRIPIMLALKPLIPDVKTWREALFAGHFGPIGVGALFVAITARAEIETDTTTPLAILPPPDFEHDNIITLIWPITTFLVITSIIVHGSSIAVFTLGKHINTLTISLSYTQGNEEKYSWMDRLPRIQSRSRSSMAKDDTDDMWDQADPEMQAGGDYTANLPRNFLRRQKESDSGRVSSWKHGNKRRRWENGFGAGGPISQSAISPVHAQMGGGISSPERTDSDTLAAHSEESPEHTIAREKRDYSDAEDEDPDAHAYEEGDEIVIENAEGEVLSVQDSRDESRSQQDRHLARETSKLVRDGRLDKKEVERERQIADEESPGESPRRRYPSDAGLAEGSGEAGSGLARMRRKLSAWGSMRQKDPKEPEPSQAPTRKSGPARAFKFGRTIIIEDEDGEVIQKYDIPPPEPKERKQSTTAGPDERSRMRLQRMGTWLGFNPETAGGEEGEASGDGLTRRTSAAGPSTAPPEQEEDDGVRFTMGGDKRRMSKLEFIRQIQSLDPRFRAEVVDDSNAPDAIKDDLREAPQDSAAMAEVAVGNEAAADSSNGNGNGNGNNTRMSTVHENSDGDEAGPPRQAPRPDDSDTEEEDRSPRGPRRPDDGLYPVDSHNADIPVHSVSADLRRFAIGPETAAQRRRRQLSLVPSSSTPQSNNPFGPHRRASASRSPPHQSNAAPPPPAAAPRRGSTTSRRRAQSNLEEGETPAERRRREAALGVSKEDSDSDAEDAVARERRLRADGGGGAAAATTGASAGGGAGSAVQQSVPESAVRPGIRFMEQPSPRNAGGETGSGGTSRFSKLKRK